jgi:hypothetical protein
MLPARRRPLWDKEFSTQSSHGSRDVLVKRRINKDVPTTHSTHVYGKRHGNLPVEEVAGAYLEAGGQSLGDHTPGRRCGLVAPSTFISRVAVGALTGNT